MSNCRYEVIIYWSNEAQAFIAEVPDGQEFISPYRMGLIFFDRQID